jgi:hypothetical protein
VSNAIGCLHVKMKLLRCMRLINYFDKGKDYSYVVQAIVEYVTTRIHMAILIIF